MSNNGFVFVREDPAKFEAPEWVPDKARLFRLCDGIYKQIRLSPNRGGGPTNATKMIEDLLDYIGGLGFKVAVDVLEAQQDVIAANTPPKMRVQEVEPPAKMVAKKKTFTPIEINRAMKDSVDVVKGVVKKKPGPKPKVKAGAKS